MSSSSPIRSTPTSSGPRCAWRCCARWSASCWRFRWPTCLARSESRYKNVLVMLVVLPLFVGNAVRAAGWMTLFGSKGALNAGLLQLGVIDAPLQIMFTEKAVIIGIIAVNLPYMVLTLQSVLEGIAPQRRGGGIQPGRRPLGHVSPRAVAAGAPRHHRRRHPLLHPGHECLCDAHAAGRPAIQDDGAAGVWAVSPQQLAVRGSHRLRSDDGHSGADGSGQCVHSPPLHARPKGSRCTEANPALFARSLPPTTRADHCAATIRGPPLQNPSCRRLDAPGSPA